MFIFDSENGGIDGWNPAVGATGPGPSTVTEVAVSNGANAVYKGLTIAQASDGHTYLYAANFRSGRVEVYDDTFTPVELPGGLFVDTKIPAGYAPFNVQELAGQLYVSYAKQDATLHDDVAGSGRGFVDVFTNDGALVRRLVAHGQLDSPWGLALAPSGFGQFAGALLVGNFGNGHINAYNKKTGARLGQLKMTQRSADRHRRAVGTDVRQRECRQDRRAPVQRRTGRRVARPARQDRHRRVILLKSKAFRSRRSGRRRVATGGVIAPARVRSQSHDAVVGSSSISVRASAVSRSAAAAASVPSAVGRSGIEGAVLIPAWRIARHRAGLASGSRHRLSVPSTPTASDGPRARPHGGLRSASHRPPDRPKRPERVVE